MSTELAILLAWAVLWLESVNAFIFDLSLRCDSDISRNGDIGVAEGRSSSGNSGSRKAVAEGGQIAWLLPVCSPGREFQRYFLRPRSAVGF